MNTQELLIKHSRNIVNITYYLFREYCLFLIKKYKQMQIKKCEDLLFGGYVNLPNNRLFETWGDELIITEDNEYIVHKGNITYIILQSDNEYYVILMDEFTEVLTFYDIYEPNDKTNNTFIRTINNRELYYYKGQCNLLNNLCYYIT